MKSNGLLKWLLIPIVLLVVFVGVRLLSSPPTPSPARSASEAASELTAEEMKSLGIEGDTPEDTVATLVAQVKELRTELKSALEGNKQQKAENQRLRQRESAIDRRIQSALEAERDRSREDREQGAREQERIRSLLLELQQQLDRSSPGHADLPVGLGLREEDAYGPHDVSSLQWVEPQDARPADRKTGSRPTSSASTAVFPTSFGPALDDTKDTPSSDGDKQPEGGVSQREVKKADTTRPIYTVPANSTLMGAVAMTALIGRIPVDGAIDDPYPFKVLIGADNLSANGVELPEVAGAIASGTASGDWTWSCVRGQIRSITFVFHDGTIRTVGSTASGNGTTGDTLRSGLGWISDPHGIPCVSGLQRSNAQQYLTSRSLITAAGAGAASLIDSDSGSISYVSPAGSLGTVGISGNEAMGRILSGGVQDLAQWVNKLYGQAFAAVYVPPGAKVAIHIEQPLAIDYDAAGRKVNHTLGASHVSDLD
ncbi:integrating conjugative element protein [Steroidobacter agaridevorans]|uniref:Integrating conjugative element protein n=1 Tax=Steroidobacter agaridevorans TaxID=2695856 RepID=A0A829Y8R8_9GAMM|nr:MULTISPECIES: TIGR03752 family integrating conjugative element protein [Steroidobacteraceae]GFE79156.1 integrating conjugative element protein [Steroidobacter agaridevorans]